MPNDTTGALLVAQGATPPYTEVTRTGNLWNITTSAAAVAGLVAVPTTVSALSIYNNNPGNSAISLLVDQIWAINVIGTAAPNAFGLYAMVTTQRVAPTNGALSIFSQSGRAASATVAGGSIITIVGETGLTANGWRPWGNPVSWGASGAATPGPSIVADINARYAVPPGTSLCLQVMSSVVGQTFQVGASFVVAQSLATVA